MSRVAYVNGRYVPHREAFVHVEDRGYQFADGVYEVIGLWKGRPIDLDGHLDRLDRSLRELEIPYPMPRKALVVVTREVVRRNRVRDGIVYMQVTRGVSPRNHPYPDPAEVPPALVLTAKHGLSAKGPQMLAGVKVVSHPDIRWGRCDIKSVVLLPNVMAKQAARLAGGYEALLVNADGMVTEGSSSNAWIVDAEGTLVTRPLTDNILGGITRQRILSLAKAAGIKVEERAFSLEEAKAAREVFISSSNNFCMPVVQVDDAVIANGHPGTTAEILRKGYLSFLDSLDGPAWYGA